MNAKRTLALFLVATCLLCVLSACVDGGAEPDGTDTPENSAVPQAPEIGAPIYAVWVSYYELPKAIGAGEEEYRAAAQTMFHNITRAGLNTVFLHVRPFADAIYPSALFPWSVWLGGAQGEDPGYDPLQILLEEAHAQELRLHAWINPFRVLSVNDPERLSPTHPARIWLEDTSGQSDGLVYRSADGIYLNPAAPQVQKLVLDGSRELLDGYAVDGLHIDDYFYPTTNAAVDQKEYGAYKAAGGSLTLADWRRENIHSFVAALYTAAHSRGRLMSISPCGDIARNRKEYFADTAQWLQTPGYADFLVPQLYYGFKHEKLPFTEVMREWADLTRQPSSLVWGLAAYKSGQPDENAGSGEREWIDTPDVIERQLQAIRTLDETAGFALFSYAHLFGKDAPKGLLDAVRAYTKHKDPMSTA